MYNIKNKHYSQVALSAKSVTITQMNCVHYYNFVRRSVDGSPTLTLFHVPGQ